MPPSPLDDRVVVALSRPVRPQELSLRLDSGSAAPGGHSRPPVLAAAAASLKAANLTCMPSPGGAARSLKCGCSSASCCTVAAYDKDSQAHAHAVAAGSANAALGSSAPGPATQMVNSNENAGSLSPSGGVGSPVAGSPKQLASIKIIYPNDLAKKMTKFGKSLPPHQGPVIIDCRPFMEYNKSHIQGAVHVNCADKISRRRLQQGKIAVLDLISCRDGKDSFKRIFSKEIIVYDKGLLSYKRLPATDSNKQNLRQYFEEAFEFIEEAHQCGKGLLIHCQAGVSRSATIVIAYLMKHTRMTMTDAYKFVKGKRPIISPNLNFMGQLLEFEEDLNNGVTPRILTPKLMGVETVV
uniref:Dual specificity phosphatase 10 n=1 Tax=Rousettus aegyptiacus TaxID=9407 RepID=A0A7J8B906_ROUAE|nr:dual specificity phosphatase 10 [Rousettus aegyptiacus]